ncbi:alginate lyase family protein [Parapedobacter koreensis]|uniref:Alginate lyase n=1 Tax=Parapedobacter koreensis TaxID=332977 RepID=A0A1H7JTM5_9SPHI|nr:alginate lyase family protein [Parapedobacter koreensis]SEK77724.1 Alginate lyase [Parapedobacter koreensis]
MKKFWLIIIGLLLGRWGAAQQTEEPFVHPGILHTEDALMAIKQAITENREPWANAYALFLKDRRASYQYDVNGPYDVVSRMGSQPNEPNLHKKEFEDDCLAAYYNAVQWRLTGDQRHAAKAVEIMDGYARELKEVINHDRELMASLCGHLLVNAAELIRHSDADWDTQRIAAFERMVREVLYPVIAEFATFANGNWDAACIKAMMTFGVFLDDREMFDRAVTYFYKGEGNGRLTHYVINEAGQCQESGRDQAHTQFGLGCLAEACEIGYNQGLDMYGAAENRLLAGFEYTAKYNLGFDVPFSTWLDRTGKYYHAEIAHHDRGKWRGVFEIVLNHYEKRAKLNPFYTRMVVDKIMPEGEPWTADHPGYGTLLFRSPN